jgi:hypothetical protein
MAMLNVNQPNSDRLTYVEDALDRAMSVMQTVRLVHGDDDPYINLVAREIQTAIDEMETHRMNGIRAMVSETNKAKRRVELSEI